MDGHLKFRQQALWEISIGSFAQLFKDLGEKKRAYWRLPKYDIALIQGIYINIKQLLGNTELPIEDETLMTN